MLELFNRTWMLLFALVVSPCMAEKPLVITLQEVRPYKCFGRLHVGAVEDGTSSDISFRLINPGNKEVILTKPTGTCGCLRVKMSSAEIAPGGSVDGVLSIKVDAKRQPFWRQRLFFDGEDFGDASVELEVVSDITGLLAFRDKEFLVQLFGTEKQRVGIAPKTVQKALRFSATPPLKIGALELTVSPEHPAIKSEIVQAGENSGDVLLSIDTARVDESATTLLCRLVDKKSGKSADIRGVIARRSPISVVPTTIRFSRGENGRLVGHAVVARHRVDGDKEAKATPVVRARLLGRELNVTSKQAGRSVSRVAVQIPESLEDRLVEESEARIIWDVVWDSDRTAKDSRIYLDWNPILPVREIPIHQSGFNDP